MYTNYTFGINKKGFEQTTRINGSIKQVMATRLVRKDAYAMKAIRLMTGTLNAENISRILVGKAGNVVAAQARVNSLMDKLANIEFMNDMVKNIWPSITQRIYLKDESIQPSVISNAIRSAGVQDKSEVHALTDVICSMLARTSLIATSKPMSAVYVQDNSDITMDDLELEVMLQTIESAFNEATYSVSFDSDKTTPQIIAMKLSERAETIYDNLRWVETSVTYFRDSIAIARQSEEQYAANGAIIDKSVLQNPSLLFIMKDITMSHLIRKQPLTAPTCNMSFYETRLRTLEQTLKNSPRFEFVAPRRSVAHISVDRLHNARGLVTDVVITSHSVASKEVTVSHHLPRSNDGLIQSLTTEIEDTQTLQYYMEQVVAHDAGLRTKRSALSLLTANTPNREQIEEVTIHLIGGVTDLDLITLAVMNSSRLYLEGVKDANNFQPTTIYYKQLNEDSTTLKTCAAQPAGHVVSCENPMVMAAYCEEQEVVEPLNYTHEGFASEANEANILGNLSDYSHDDLNRTVKFSIMDTNGKGHAVNLKYYGMITNKVPHNQILLRSPYAEIHLSKYLNALKGVYDHVSPGFKDRGKINLDNQFARLVYEYIEPMMTDSGTYNLARAVGHDMMSNVTNRAERASFFHQMYEGDYYAQIAFAITKFLLLRSHRLDNNTLKWMSALFNNVNYWTLYSQSIVKQARGKGEI